MQPKVAARTVAHKTNLCHIGMYKPELTWPGPASLKNLNLPQKIIIHLDSTMLMRSHWHLTLRSVLNNKFSVLTFLRSVTCLMSIEQSICTKKMVQFQSMSSVIISLICFNKRFASRILVHLVRSLQFTWAIQQLKSSMHKIQFKLLSFDFFYYYF